MALTTAQRLTALETGLAKLTASVASLQLVPGPQGPQGIPGPQGPQGIPGGGGGGGALPNTVILDNTATGSDFLAVIDAVATVNGIIPTIYLPSGTTTLSTGKQIKKSINILGHPDGTSKLYCAGNMSVLGSGATFVVGFYGHESGFSMIDVRFSGFEIEHDRTNPANRVAAFWIADCVNSIEIDHMTGTNITADWAHHLSGLSASDPAVNTRSISIHDCTVKEWYESFFLARFGFVSKIWIYNNVATTKAANPNSSISRPYGVDLGIEQFPGEVTKVVIADNIFDMHAIPTGEAANSFGFVLSEGGSSGPSDAFRYDDVSVRGNTFNGFFYGVYVSGVDSIAGGSFINIANNEILNSRSYPIFVRPYSGFATAVDHIVIAKNHALVGGGPSHPVVDLTDCPAYDVTLIDNFYEGTWD